MLLVRGFDGLGFSVLPQGDRTNQTPTTGGGSTPLPTGAGFETMTVYKPPTPGIGYTRQGIYQIRLLRTSLLYGLQHQVMMALREAHTSGQLAGCSTAYPAGARGAALVDLNKTCNFWGSQWSASLLNRLGQIPGQSLIRPIGVIDILGLPFLPTDLKLGNPRFPEERTIEATVTPSPDARFMLDRAIYIKSQIDIYSRYYGGDMSDYPDTEAYLASANFTKGTERSINEFVSAVMLDDGKPWLTWLLDGYSMSPLTPTDAELTGKGGLAAYYARGGFLLSRTVAQGLQPVAPTGLQYTTGYCWSDKCGSSSFVPGNDAIARVQNIAGEGEGWLIFVTVGPQYGIRVQAKDRSTAASVKNFITDLITKLPAAMCTVAPFAQGWSASKLTAEVCQYPISKESCTKGEISKTWETCKCSAPPDAQISAVALGNGAMKFWCSKMNPDATAPPIGPPPMPEPSPFPWWMVIVGGVAVGSYLLVTRK